MQRYSQFPFPAYRYVPAELPHPMMVSKPSEQDEQFRFGVDLFNHGYFWEAHEVWEGLWVKSKNEEKLLLQAVILYAAGLLKLRQDQLKDFSSLTTAGFHKLNNLNEIVFFNINISKWQGFALNFKKRIEQEKITVQNPWEEQDFPFIKLEEEL
ncbi:MAG: DUF309 domain-containing protein [Deltaproteobacteria bacterium]|nr:DUF309 domain-containing protein [Deltaproteobacteria bacterium]